MQRLRECEGASIGKRGFLCLRDGRQSLGGRAVSPLFDAEFNRDVGKSSETKIMSVWPQHIVIAEVPDKECVRYLQVPTEIRKGSERVSPSFSTSMRLVPLRLEDENGNSPPKDD